MSRSLDEFRAALNGLIENPSALENRRRRRRGRSRPAQHVDVDYESPGVRAYRQRRGIGVDVDVDSDSSGQDVDSDGSSDDDSDSDSDPRHVGSFRSGSTAMVRSRGVLSSSEDVLQDNLDIDDNDNDDSYSYSAPAQPSRRPRRPRRSRKSQASAAAPTPAQRQSGGKLTYKQSRVIGLSVGGLQRLDPSGRSRTYLDALKGVTAAQASKVIEAMTSAGVLRAHPGVQTSAAQQARAIKLLERHTSFHMPQDNLDVHHEAPARRPAARRPAAPRPAAPRPRMSSSGPDRRAIMSVARELQKKRGLDRAEALRQAWAAARRGR